MNQEKPASEAESRASITPNDAVQTPTVVVHRTAPQAADFPYADLRWLDAVCKGLGHRAYVLEARVDDKTTGLLPLAYVRSMIFGRFLVSLPYVNSAGVSADDDASATALIGRAAELADEWNVKYLELRHECEQFHPRLTDQMTTKVHMRLSLPQSADELWTAFSAKVRNQIRKGEKSDLQVDFGRHDKLNEFYAVFARNMRDLGTPVFGKPLFASILDSFGDDAELCVVRNESQPIAAALLVHGHKATEVPSASSLREFNRTNCNMLMYWHLLQRTIEREQPVFDFGRSSKDSNTYRFKKQWGAEPFPAVWQYYVRQGSVGELRLENPKYQRAVRIWQRLPLWIANRIGPKIVRGIP